MNQGHNDGEMEALFMRSGRTTIKTDRLMHPKYHDIGDGPQLLVLIIIRTSLDLWRRQRKMAARPGFAHGLPVVVDQQVSDDPQTTLQRLASKGV